MESSPSFHLPSCAHDHHQPKENESLRNYTSSSVGSLHNSYSIPSSHSPFSIFLPHKHVLRMKRASENQLGSNVNKKLKLHSMGTKKTELQIELDRRLKENPDLYKSIQGWDLAELTAEAEKLGIHFDGIRKDKYDELIEISNGPLSSPSLLLFLGKDVQNLQQRYCLTHLESNKFKVFHNAELRERLDEDGSNIYVPDSEMNQGIQRIDFTFPFLLNVGEFFNEFKTKVYQQLGDENKPQVTVKMLKDNPEEHGLEKGVLDGFSDQPEVIDIHVNIRGRKKRVKAFKDGENILIPCTEKNCRHKQFDVNDVSICASQATLASEVKEVTSPKIDAVYSTSTSSNISTNDTPSKEAEQENDKSESPAPAAVEEEKPENEEEDEDDSSTKQTPINIATNIFEEIDDEYDNEEEEEDLKKFDVPQIVSIMGGVDMLTPETILTENVAENVVIKSSSTGPDDSNLRDSRRAAMMAERVEFPKKKIINAKEYIACRICNKQFPASCLNLYRNHLKNKHNIEIEVSVNGSQGESPGRAGKVTFIGPRGKLKSFDPKAPTTTVDWYKCKACDQLLQQKDTASHLAACCPNLKDVAFKNVASAFDVVQIGTGKSSAVPLFCGLCDKSCDSRIGLRQHLTTSHKELSPRILLDPDLRCASCLTRFDDSVHLTIHCVTCTNRRATAETMLELAKGMLQCDVCLKPHATINETQECYTKTGLIRCLICLNTVVSRGNFFHHMKAHHFRNTIGICCPFCDIGEIPIRDCFIHILESHYNPILQFNTTSCAGLGIAMNSSNKIVVNSPEHLPKIKTVKSPASAPPASKGLTASRLVMPALRPASASALVRPSQNAVPMMTVKLNSNQVIANQQFRPQIIAVRTITPAQLGTTTVSTGNVNAQTITLRPGQIVNSSGLIRGAVANPGIRQFQIAGTNAVARPIPIGSVSNALLRQVRPLSPLRNLRPIRPAISSATTGVNPIQKGSIMPITPAQLQLQRGVAPISSARSISPARPIPISPKPAATPPRVAVPPAIRVNFSSVNILNMK